MNKEEISNEAIDEKMELLRDFNVITTGYNSDTEYACRKELEKATSIYQLDRICTNLILEKLNKK